MARIRSIKPELFRHEGLYEAEKTTGLPLRTAWTALFCVADKEGRFRWQPRVIKLDILPWDDVDPSRVLDEFVTMKLLIRYEDETGEQYGQIINWHKHQRVRSDESDSTLPNPNDCKILDKKVTSSSRYRDLVVTESRRGNGSGSGKEVELERKGNIAGVIKNDDTTPESTQANPDGFTPTALCWRAYRDAYAKRWKEPPPWNAKIAGQLKSFVSRIPIEDAPEVASFYLTHNDQKYVRSMHPVGLLLLDAEKLRTEWATGRKITSIDARNTENTDAWKSQAQRVAQKFIEGSGS